MSFLDDLRGFYDDARGWSHGGWRLDDPFKYRFNNNFSINFNPKDFKIGFTLRF